MLSFYLLAYSVSTIIAKNLLVELAEENTSSKLGSEVESLTEVLILPVEVTRTDKSKQFSQ